MLGFNLNGTPYFYIRNLQGDVVAIIDADGIIVARYAYDAWGNHLYVSDTEIAQINPIRYRGYYWDSETQLYYLQSRYYDPQLRRFISADVYMDTGVGILGTNMYAYCNNDPVNLWDPDGRAPVFVISDRVLNSFLQFSSMGRWNLSNATEQLLLRGVALLGVMQYTSMQGLDAYNFRIASQVFNETYNVLSGEITFRADGQTHTMEFTTGRRQNLFDYWGARSMEGRLAANETYRAFVSGYRSGTMQNEARIRRDGGEPTGSANNVALILTLTVAVSYRNAANSSAGRLQRQVNLFQVSGSAFMFTPTRV